MYCIGLTGGIASGKTTVAGIFARLGIACISADAIAKELTKPGQHALAQIFDHYGAELKQEDGRLNRALLRDIIFNNRQQRLWLEALLHPLIREQIAEKIQHCRSPYSVIEIPLLSHKHAYAYLNRVLLIKAPKTQQIKRLIARDGTSMTQALAILESQVGRTSHPALADDVVINRGSLASLETQILRLHQDYLAKAKS